MFHQKRCFSAIMGLTLKIKGAATASKYGRILFSLIMTFSVIAMVTLFTKVTTPRKDYLLLDDTFDTPVQVEIIRVQRWSMKQSRYIAAHLDKLNAMVLSGHKSQILEKGGNNQEEEVMQEQDSQDPNAGKHRFIPRYSFTHEDSREVNDRAGEVITNEEDYIRAKNHRHFEKERRMRYEVNDRAGEVITNEEDYIRAKNRRHFEKERRMRYEEEDGELENDDLEKQGEEYLYEGDDEMAMKNEIPNVQEKVPPPPPYIKKNVRTNRRNGEMDYRDDKVGKFRQRYGEMERIRTDDEPQGGRLKGRYVDTNKGVRNRGEDLQYGEAERKFYRPQYGVLDKNGKLHRREKTATNKPEAPVKVKLTNSKTVYNFPIERMRRPDSKIPKQFFNVKHTVNPHKYDFILRPNNTCQKVNGSEIFLIIPIVSSVENFKLRQTIRQTWGKFTQVYNQRVRFVFMLGAPKLPFLQKFIQEESDIYKDIVQESFIDTYFNGTLKAISTLRWVSTYCPSAHYMLRINDDVMLHTYKLIRYLLTRGLPQTKLYWGQGFHHSRLGKSLVKHNYRSKIPWNDGALYPGYCNGPYIIMTMDTVRNMYKMSWRTPLMFPEDVYMGILAEKLGIRIYDASMHLVDQHEEPSPISRFRTDKNNDRPEFMGHLGSDEMTMIRFEYLWRMIEMRTTDKTGCVTREKVNS